MAVSAAPHFGHTSWRELVAVGVVANDLTAQTIARCAGVALTEATRALHAAENEGVLHNGVIDPAEGIKLVSELPNEVVAEVHMVVARYLLSEGPSRLLEAIGHFRSAGTLFPSTELAAIADRAASTSLSVGDYHSARQFLEFAHDIGMTDAPALRAQRLCRLGTALDGLGLVADARARFAAAFDIAEADRDSDTAIEAAVSYALPVDWYAGDRRTTALLQRAELLVSTEEHRVKVLAARAMSEMRIPLPGHMDQQIAWVTRPSVAQPMAEVALEGSTHCSDPTRLLALLAWRTTHRDPRFLEQRRRRSTEAFDLAQQLRLPNRQVDAAVMLAVDALESADRPGFDHALTVLRWVAEADGNPRLAWLAHSVAAGTALLDGDAAAAERHRHAAREVGIAIQSPGWLSAELLLHGQEVLFRGDHDEIRRHLPDDAGTELLNPLGKLIVGLGHATVGHHDQAHDLLRRGIRQFDPEASWLLCLTRAVDLVIHLDESIDVDDVIENLWQSLVPWHDHVAVDSQAWFCDGPVSAWLAFLANRRGDAKNAHKYLTEAEPVARRLGDARTLARLASLRMVFGRREADASVSAVSFTSRELRVLQLMVNGLSNSQIAELLAYSPSTVRNDLTAIYRKFGVATRAEAAAAAIQQGLCDASSHAPSA